MEEIPEFVANTYSIRLKIKKMLSDLTGREFKLNKVIIYIINCLMSF